MPRNIHKRSVVKSLPPAKMNAKQATIDWIITKPTVRFGYGGKISNKHIINYLIKKTSLGTHPKSRENEEDGLYNEQL